MGGTGRPPGKTFFLHCQRRSGGKGIVGILLQLLQVPGVAREHLLQVRRLVLWAAALGSRYQSHALQEWTSSLNALPYFTLPYFTLPYFILPYPTLPSVILSHDVATARLLQDSAFGTLCSSAICTPHHVDFRLLNLLACRIPPAP